MKLRILTIFMLLLTWLTACTEQMPIAKDGSYESRVRGVPIGKLDCYHDFVYANSGVGSLYDTVSGDFLVTLCEDLECNGECLYEMRDVKFAGVRGGQLYFSSRGSDGIVYARRDFMTVKTEVLLELSKMETTPQENCYLDREWLYYNRYLLREGGDPDNMNDYLLYICRIPVDGGESEIVYSARGNSELLWMVAEDKLYTVWENTIYRIDVETGETRALFNSEEAGYRSSMGHFQYLDGYLYFVAFPYGNTISLPNNTNCATCIALIRLNVESGAWEQVIDEPIITYCLTNDAIYFAPLGIHQVSDPEKYAASDKATRYLAASSTLYACDLDGSNPHPVWTDETGLYDYVGLGFTVVDNVLYGYINCFDQNTNSFGDRYGFAEIHFDTGEIIMANIIE